MQTIGAPLAQAPVAQESDTVHGLPSVQVAPSFAVGLEQAPVAVSHVPALWHWSLAVQTTGFPPVQVPVRHVSVCVHELSSLHAVPFARLVPVHFEAFVTDVE